MCRWLFCFSKKFFKKTKIFFQSRKELASLACRMQARSTKKEVKSGYDGSGIHVVDGFRLDRPRMNDKQTALLQKVLLTLSGEDKETMQQIIKTYGGLKK